MTLLESPTEPRTKFDWSEQRVEQLTHMWVDEERSAAAIAAEFGITRSAILGKIDRLGINGRECDMENRSKGAEMRETRNRLKATRLAEKAARTPRAAMACVPVQVMSAVAPCALLDLDDTKCHWPFGEPQQPGFHFCGGKAADGPYCAGHHSIAYRRAG